MSVNSGISKIKDIVQVLDSKGIQYDKDVLNIDDLLEAAKKGLSQEEYQELLKRLELQNSFFLKHKDLARLQGTSISPAKIPYHEKDGDIFFLVFMEMNQKVRPFMAVLPKGSDLIFVPIQSKLESEKTKILNSSLSYREKRAQLNALSSDDDYSFFEYKGEEIVIPFPLKEQELGISIHFPDFSKEDELIQDKKEVFERIEKLLFRFFDHSVSFYFPIISSFPFISVASRFIGWTPYLFLTSKAGGRGKSNVLRLMSHLSYNGVYFSAGSTIRGIVRLIHKYKCSVALDELDKNSEDAKKEISGILNNGSEDAEGGYIITNPDSKGDILVFDCFGTKYLAGNSTYGIADSTLSRTIMVDCTKANRNIERLTGATAKDLEHEFNKIRCSILYHVMKNKETIVNTVNRNIVRLKEKYKNNDRGVETVAFVTSIIEIFDDEKRAEDIENFLIRQMILDIDSTISDKEDAILRGFLEVIIDGVVDIEDGKVEIPSSMIRDRANQLLGQDSQIKNNSRLISKVFRSLNAMISKKVLNIDGKHVNGYVIDVNQLWKSLEREDPYVEIVSDYSSFFQKRLDQFSEEPVEPEEQELDVSEILDTSDDLKKIEELILQELNEKDSLKVSDFIFDHKSDFLIRDVEKVISELKKKGEIFEPIPDVLKTV